MTTPGPALDAPRPSIVLVGLSGNTREFLEMIGQQCVIRAILSDAADHGPTFRGYPVLPLSAAATLAGCRFLFLIGSEKSYLKRRAMIADLGIAPDRYATLCHPAAVVSRDATLGAGTILSSGVTVTTQAQIGRHVIVLPNSVIHHDVHVGDHSIIGSNVTIAGDVRIGESCYIGSASSLRNGITIGAGALIGMAANVVSDVAPGAVMVGNPARPLRMRADEGRAGE